MNRPADIYRFTCGDCHILARALNQMTGWPIHALIEPDYPEQPDFHAFVLTPEGRALDVEGLHDLPYMRMKYGGSDLEWAPFTYKEILRTWGGADISKWSYRRSTQIGMRMLSWYFGLTDAEKCGTVLA